MEKYFRTLNGNFILKAIKVIPDIELRVTWSIQHRVPFHTMVIIVDILNKYHKEEVVFVQ